MRNKFNPAPTANSFPIQQPKTLAKWSFVYCKPTTRIFYQCDQTWWKENMYPLANCRNTNQGRRWKPKTNFWYAAVHAHVRLETPIAAQWRIKCRVRLDFCACRSDLCGSQRQHAPIGDGGLQRYIQSKLLMLPHAFPEDVPDSSPHQWKEMIHITTCKSKQRKSKICHLFVSFGAPSSMRLMIQSSWDFRIVLTIFFHIMYRDQEVMIKDRVPGTLGFLPLDWWFIHSSTHGPWVHGSCAVEYSKYSTQYTA